MCLARGSHDGYDGMGMEQTGGPFNGIIHGAGLNREDPENEIGHIIQLENPGISKYGSWFSSY